MSQEKIHGFPQGDFTELCHRLCVLLDGHMQGVVRSENLSRRNEAFQIGCNKRIDRLRIKCQPTEDLIGYTLRL